MVSVLLATAALAAAIYEWVATKTGRVPTISRGVTRLPVWSRLLLIAALAAVLLDHWVIRIAL